MKERAAGTRSLILLGNSGTKQRELSEFWRERRLTDSCKRHATEIVGKKANLPVKSESKSCVPEISSVINNYVNVSLSIEFPVCPFV